MTVYDCKTTDNWPVVGTKVRVVKDKPYVFKAGDEVYVAGYTYGGMTGHQRRNQGIVVSASPGTYHGSYLDKWEVVGESPVANLTSEQKQALTDLALASAEKHGYCDETKNVLADIGLPTEATAVEKKVTVEITYTGDAEFDIGFLEYDDFAELTIVDKKVVKPVVEDLDF